MTKKRMQVVVDEIITGPCPDCKVHAGVQADIRSFCAKMMSGDGRLEEKIDDREKLANIRFDSLKESISVAKDTMDSRLQGMNNLTHQLDTQRVETKEKILELTSTFLPKDRFDAEHKIFAAYVDSKIAVMESRIIILEKLANQRIGSTIWVTVIVTAFCSGVVFLILRSLLKF